MEQQDNQQNSLVHWSKIGPQNWIGMGPGEPDDGAWLYFRIVDGIVVEREYFDDELEAFSVYEAAKTNLKGNDEWWS